MRDLITNADFNAWTLYSAGFFLCAFMVLAVWVYLPSRKEHYVVNGKIPLSE